MFAVAVLNSILAPPGGPGDEPGSTPSGGDDSQAPVVDAADGIATAVLVLAFVAFFALGAGPITWLYLSEILPASIKGQVAGLATFLAWAGNLGVALSFVPLMDGLGLGPVFIVYAACTALGAAFVHLRMVETKKKSLREVRGCLLTFF